jgi:hypothetical protein
MGKRVGQPAGRADRVALAAALRAWRGGAELMEHPALADDRAAYERAAAALGRRLEGIDSVAGLAEHYAADRGAAARAAAAAGRRAGPSREVLVAVAVDTAFWRRCRQLVAAAVG